MRTLLGVFLVVAVAVPLLSRTGVADERTAENRVTVTLPPHAFASALLSSSPFGINTALRPDASDLEERLEAMQRAGIKWGRQDFTWRRIERAPGEYDWAPYDRLVAATRGHGILLFGNLAYAPEFHDPRTDEGVHAYCALARAAARRYRGRIDHWQIWNEPNGGFWKGSHEDYAHLMAAAGSAIHEANPDAKVLGLNMAFCDVLWAGKVLKLVPYDSFDIACFHPYRAQCAPEEPFDWWMRDQYVKSWHKGELTDDYPLIRMSFLEQTDALLDVMREFGEPKPIWITEICWNTDIHPYGVSELRQADLLVRFHALAAASPHIEKVFWWTLSDRGTRQFDKSDMVGLLRADLSPKYAYSAYGWMTRMLEGKRWVRSDAFGPVVYALVFRDASDVTDGCDLIFAWATKPYAYVRITNEKGLDVYDIFGTRRSVPVDPVRTKHLPVPLGESPVYVIGARGMKATVRPDPGW